MILKRENVERVTDNQTVIDKLISMGFKAVGDVSADTYTAEKNIDKMSLIKLKALAKEQGIDGAGSLTRAELLAVLKDVNSSD